MKVEDSVTGPFKVTIAGLGVPVNDPAPLPVHPLKVNKAFAVAVIVTEFETVAPFAGAVMLAAGGVVSAPEPGVVTGRLTSSMRNVVVAELSSSRPR